MKRDQALPINLEDYDYNLSDEKIAKHPLPNRDHAKLLVYDKGNIQHRTFYEIPQIIPSNGRLFFNNTRVIAARILLHKPGEAGKKGAAIEIFLLSPISPTLEINKVMASHSPTTWYCMIGNLKKWKNELILTKQLTWQNKNFTLQVSLEDRDEKIVKISWTDPDLTLAQVIEAAGKVPLPPYINRDPITEDRPRYQTVYSKMEGAVAAPTAGLHFTPEILEKMKLKGIKQEFLTLHVSAGTFQPIKTQNVLDHPMHAEQIVIDYHTITQLLDNTWLNISVGTTSLRTLESIYWLGCLLEKNKDWKTVLNPESFPHFKIDKLLPYQLGTPLPLPETAIKAIKNTMEILNLESITGSTEIFIYPGYQFKICHGLLTNFHLPKSTLLLLVAAFIGNDWKKVYEDALNKDYRFLSYGDTSLLFPVHNYPNPLYDFKQE